MPGNSRYQAARKADLAACSKGGIARDAKRPVSENLKIVLLEEAGEPYPRGTSKARALAHKMVAEALKGNVPAIKEVIDRVEGKDSASAPGVAVQIVISAEDAKVL